MVDTNSLHLPDLTIRGFRGIQDLSIPHLGRVTLLAGKNSVGKTTVLEAVRVYAARGRFSVLSEMLTNREEVVVDKDEDGDSFFEPNWTALFYGRSTSRNAHISIGPANVSDQLSISTTSLADHLPSPQLSLFVNDLPDHRMQALRIVFRENQQVIPLVFPFGPAGTRSVSRRIRNELVHRGLGSLPSEDELPPQIKGQSLGPGLLSNFELADLWGSVALTEDEDHAVRALGLIFGAEVDRVAVVGLDPRIRSRSSGMRAVVKLRNQERPVPLRSLGDGALRLFGVALALANSRGGFLLIDEAENGIHYALQRDFWRMVLSGAQENNVQVLATTHSWDCIKGFAQAAKEAEDAEGVLVRLSRQDDALRAVEYPEEELAIATEQGIEVR